MPAAAFGYGIAEVILIAPMLVVQVGLLARAGGLMSRSDARNEDSRRPGIRTQSHDHGFADALKRDAREFAGVAEYEFRKLVGAARTLQQRQPGPTKTDNYERRPIGRRKPKTNSATEPDARRARQDKPNAASQSNRKVDRPGQE